MVTTNRAGMVVAEQFAGKVITDYVTPYVDKAMGKELEPTLTKPSTLINIIGGLGMVAYSVYGKRMSPDTEEALLIVGSNMLTKGADYVAEAIKPTAGAMPARYGAVANNYAVRAATQKALPAPVTNGQIF